MLCAGSRYLLRVVVTVYETMMEINNMSISL